jgi:chaperone required for assembly of F1-ATPase
VKRFWSNAQAVAREGGWAVELDGKPLRTPAKAPLIVPTQALAEAIASEWTSVEDKVDPRALPLTGLANAAIDRIQPDKAVFASGVVKYGETDLACYRAHGPSELVARQAEEWDAMLSWARRRYDVDFDTTQSVVHVAQPTATVDRLAHAVASLDAFRLAGLSPLVTAGGSLIAALAVLEQALSVEAAWNAVTVDDRWQLEKWGSDPDAEVALENCRRDFFAAARFLELLDG